jgi:hypothetical protein
VSPSQLLQQPVYPRWDIRRLREIKARVVIRVQVEPIEVSTQTVAFALAGLIFMLLMFVFTRESLFSRV